MAWYDNVDDRELAFWEAYDSLEPIGDEHVMFANLGVLLDAIYRACLLTNVDQANMPSPATFVSFLPEGMKPKRKAARRRPSLEEQLNLIK